MIYATSNIVRRAFSSRVHYPLAGIILRWALSSGESAQRYGLRHNPATYGIMAVAGPEAALTLSTRRLAQYRPVQPRSLGRFHSIHREGVCHSLRITQPPNNQPPTTQPPDSMVEPGPCAIRPSNLTHLLQFPINAHRGHAVQLRLAKNHSAAWRHSSRVSPATTSR